VIPISLVEGIVTLLRLIALELGQLYLSSGRPSMPVMVKGETYYRTSEVCAIVGVSRSTLLRWLRDGILGDVHYRDRRGWRLFAEADVSNLKAEADRIETSQIAPDAGGGLEQVQKRPALKFKPRSEQARGGPRRRSVPSRVCPPGRT
jgi:excisionase family DNA binding protein